MNQTTVLDERGWVNETDLGWANLWSDDTTAFNLSGTYNLTLFTFTESNITDVQTGGAENGVYNYWDNASIEFTAYEEKGNFTSQVYDTGSYSMWTNASWEQELPFGTDIELRIRTGNSPFLMDASWSSWSAPLTDPANSSIDRPWGRYIQYMVNLSTQYTNVTPFFRSIDISYEKFHTQGIVEMPNYMPSNVTTWYLFSHSETANDQEVDFEFSINNGTDWYPVPIDQDLRWVNVPSSGAMIKFRAILLTSNTSVTPTLHWIQLMYVASEPFFTIDCTWNRTGASPGDMIRLHVFINNTAPSDSTYPWLNISLGVGLQALEGYHTSASLTVHTAITASDAWTFGLSNLSQGNYELSVDALVLPGVEDGTVSDTEVTLEFGGTLGDPLPEASGHSTVTLQAPNISLWLDASAHEADVGDIVEFCIYVNNSGMGMSPELVLEGSVDERFDRVEHPGATWDGSALQWTLQDLAGGENRMICYYLALNHNTSQGAGVHMEHELNYTDTADFSRSVGSNTVAVVSRLRSKIALALLSQTSQIRPNENFVVTVYYNNTGFGRALDVRFNTTIPYGLELVESSEVYDVQGSEHIWTFGNVTPGPHSFTLTMRSGDISEVSVLARMTVFMEVTDVIEGEMASVDSSAISVSIERIVTIWETIYWPWSGLAMLLVGVVIAYALWSRYKPLLPSIDDAFVIYRDGRLIAHRKSTSALRPELDGDLVSVMLTTVQEFVSDSLSAGGEQKVRKMEFGDREFFVERGEYIYIAIIYSGSMRKKLDREITELVGGIEAEHPSLTKWDGRLSGLGDIDDRLDALIKNWQRGNGNNSVKIH